MNYKNNSRIELRGKLDSLNANIIFIQALCNDEKLIHDLEELRGIIRKIQRCEACNEIFDEKFILWGINEDEIHYRSHNPDKFFGLGHIMPNYHMGIISASLNLLRTHIRETELISCRVFNENDVLGINHVLNRLSSAAYILIYKYLPKDFCYELKFAKSLT